MDVGLELIYLCLDTPLTHFSHEMLKINLHSTHLISIILLQPPNNTAIPFMNILHALIVLLPDRSIHGLVLHIPFRGTVAFLLPIRGDILIGG